MRYYTVLIFKQNNTINTITIRVIR